MRMVRHLSELRPEFIEFILISSHITYHSYHIHVNTCSMITYLADIGLRHFNYNYYKCEYLHPFELFIPPTMSSDTCLLITMIAVMSGVSHPDPLCEPQAIRDTMPPSFSPEDLGRFEHFFGLTAL